ncbi:MAG: hypothetical protein MNPFHGCM_01308 [Gemmatimonadaceae bacterium]|nr:hypothetical protein [Gemmatimonadaceae bacterium]
MKSGAARSALTLAVVFSSAIVAAACTEGDARTREITVGIDQDSAFKLLGASDGKPAVIDSAGGIEADTLHNVWRRTRYVVSGRLIEFVYYSPSNEKWKMKDTIPENEVIPVVLIDGKVRGVGKANAETVAKFYGIPINSY